MESGQSFAHYSVVSKIGQGGMGEVFRATDSRLNRDVALKMLPDHLIDNTERLARFQREAQVLAALNHHGIAAIYGLESEGSRHALAMELVDGPDLSDKLAVGPLPVAEALDIALQLAEAVEAAHEKGIVHRDLKPANIKVTPEGRVKVLDFGLAKALSDDPAESGIDPAMSPTLTANMTMGNVILGTAAYMSPEQARGTEVDKRADIWAFGVIMVEMLGGRRLFAGETVSDTLASVLQATIDFDDLPEDLPVAAKRLINRCLQRDPRQRLRDIGDARLVLQDILAGDVEEEAGQVEFPRGPKASVWALLLLAGVITTAAGAWILKPGPEPILRKLEIGLDSGSPVNQDSPGLALSPDGMIIAYIENDRLWLRSLDQVQAIEVAETKGATVCAWSPDGQWLAFGVNNETWKVPRGGMGPIRVGESTRQGGSAAGMAWPVQDQIYVTSGSGSLVALPASGGRPVEVVKPDLSLEQDLHNAASLPDGRGVLFVSHLLDDGVCAIGVWDGETRKQVLHLPGDYIRNPVYSPSGHLVYSLGESETSIWAIPFSIDRLEVTGDPFLVAQNGGLPRVSSEGTLIYIHGSGAQVKYEVLLVNRQGNLLRVMGQADDIWPFPALTPDGRDVVIPAKYGGQWDLWIWDERGARIRLSDDNADEDCPVMTSDGQFVYFGSGNAANWFIKRIAADGTGAMVTLPLEAAPPHYYGSNPWLSVDGRLMLYSSKGEKTGNDIASFRLDEEGAVPEILIATNDNELAPSLSPDGEHLLYMSNVTGRFEVYLARYPSGTGRRQVSTEGGAWPRWNGDGAEVYYVVEDSLMVVEVEKGARLMLGPPRALFSIGPTTHPITPIALQGFDVTDDGENFVYIRRAEAEVADAVAKRIVYVENWFEEFR